MLVTSHPASADEAMARVEVKATPALQQRRNDVAGRVVVAREELLRYGDTTVADTLRRQPGIAINGGEVQLRGLGGGRTQFLLNGDPAPPGFSPDSLAPGLVERIEILRSASADSSAQGIAGSINIVLRKSAPRPQALAKLAGTHGMAGWSPEASLDLSRPGESFAGSLAAQAMRRRSSAASTITERGSIGERITAETGDAVNERLGLAPRLNWKSGDGNTLAWQSLFDLARSDNSGDARESTVWGEASSYPRNAYAAHAHAITARSDISASQRVGDGARLEWKAGVAHNKRASDYRFTGSNAEGTPQWLRHVQSNAIDDSGSSSGKLRTGGDGGHALAVGWDVTLANRSEWRRQDDASAGGQPLGELDQRYLARVRRMAVYAQDEWSPSPALDLYLGLRWEGLRTSTDGRDMEEVGNRSGVWSPVAHLLWRLPGKRDQVRAALARSYKAPATRDLVPRRYTVNNDNGPANPHFQGNPGLRPELAWGVDLAYEKYFSGDSMASVSAYGRRITDVTLPYLFRDAGGWVTTPRNSGRAATGGIEFDAKAALGASGATARLAMSRNWSQVDAVPGPGNRLGEQTPWIINAGMDYRPAAGMSLGFNWNIKAGGSVHTAATSWSERAMERRLDLQGSWQWRPDVTLRLSATNALAAGSRNAQRFDDGSFNTWRSTATQGERAIRFAIELTL